MKRKLDQLEELPPTADLPPLNVKDLHSSWPQWKQQFSLYLTANYDEVSDHKKLEMFLKFLGPEALQFVIHLFPQLCNIDQNSVSEVSLESDIIPRFDEYCQANIGHEMVQIFAQCIMESNETFRSYYKKLVDLFKETRITSSQQLIIRNKLISEIMDVNDVKKIQSMGNPTCEEILDYIEPLEEDVELWTRELPKLSAIEQFELFLSSLRMFSIIKDIKLIPGCFSIDNELLRKYPIETNSDIYGTFGARVECLKVNAISEADFKRLNWIFTSKTLEIHNMDLEELKSNFEDLTMVNSSLPYPTFCKAILGVRNLHLENIDLCINSKIQCQKIQLHQAEKLTIVGDMGANLWISQKSKMDTIKMVFNQTRVVLDVCADEVYYEGPPMKMCLPRNLTVKTWAGLRPESEGVQHMRPDSIVILEPVQTCYRDQIEALSKTCSVHCSLEPENLECVLNYLDEDCLLKICEYLDKRDQMMFSLCNSRINQVLRRYLCKHIKLDPGLNDVNPNRLGHFIHTKYLTIRSKKVETPNNTNEKVYKQLFPLFMNLTKLEFIRIKIPDSFYPMLPKTLHTLVFSNCELNPGPAVNEYLKRINLSLRSLTWQPSFDGYLNNFTNLTHLNVKPNMSENYLGTFLKTNGRFLNSLEIHPRHAGFAHIWPAIMSLPKLDHLVVRNNTHWEDWDFGINARFENVEKLSVCTNLENLPYLFCDVQFPKLKELSIDILCPPVDFKQVFSGFLNLEKLEIKFVDTQKVKGTHTILPLIKALPKLKVLYVSNVAMPRKQKQELIDYLSENNRNLICEPILY